MANDCVIVEYFVEFAQLEEEYLFEVRLLQIPKLRHATRKVFPFVWRNIESGVIVVWVIRPPLLFIHQVVRS